MKKIISVFLVMALLLSFAGCSKKKEGDNTPVSTAKPPKTGPVGTWDIPIPEINPLGSQGLYITTGYEPGAYGVKYIDNFAEHKKTIEGEIWTLEVKDDSGIPLTFLKDYAQKLGANLFSNQYGDRLTFNLKKDDTCVWWGDALQNETGYTLSIVKEPHIPVGKEVKFTQASTGDDVKVESVSFVTNSEGKRFQTATIKVPNGVLNLEINSEYSTGVIETRGYYTRELSTQKTTTFILDDLPQGHGSLKWTFLWNSDSTPSEFSFLLQELGEIPEIKQGDQLGALKVCGVPFGGVVAEPQKSTEVNYADGYSLEGDITPEGDTLFWLPAGYWNVVLLAEGAGLEKSKARLTPVSAGEMTVLTFPDSLKSAYASLNSIFADPENLTGGIEFVETKDMGSTASISMLVNDPKKRDVFPTIENTTIFEGGKQVKIKDISRQIAPPSVVLVLDSSGSMGKQMPATIAAAREFIKGLPDKTFIKVIDFDSQIRVLKGDTKEAVVNSLSSVTASGSTMLFDATLEGLRLLEGKVRPALVVFADGADSSLDGQGEGSMASKEDVLEAITAANIPLFSIGFGDKPDAAALKEFSSASNGEYFSAKDEKALVNVFTAIGGKFGNSFVMTYERPKESSLADTPVVSIILDASGSMDIDPAEEEGCGFRMEKTKELFHDFILKLPEECLMQMISFQTAAMGGSIIQQQQVTTSDKMKLLQGLGELDAGGGTPILDSIRIGYENLRAVPSNKKVIVYLTDAALEVDEEEQEDFEKLLGEIKKDNIVVLWAGMGVSDKKDVFVKAAELSGGRYVLSEDAAGLQSTLAEVLTLINQVKPAQGLPLSVNINEKKASGDILSYAANTSVAFAPPPKSGQIIEPDVVKISTGTPLKRYDKDVASLVTGTSVPGMDTILTKRIPFTVKESNKAMDLSVKEAFYFSKFKGLEPPDGKQFLALQLEIKNVTSNKIQYQIPSFNNHFYVNINNEGSYPASEATWITETPLSPPGNPEVNIFPKEDLVGMLMFLVPDIPMIQTSLHFYDTENGHINMPLMGRMDKELLELEKLPKEDPVKISDAFSMTLKGSSVVDKIDIYQAENNTSFRVIEADFDSKVQALLDIDPAQRLWLRVNTNQGPLLTKMSDVSATMPFGFIYPVMLAPGSANKVRFAYPVANALTGTKAEIWGDLNSGSLEIPLVKGSPYGTAVDKPKASIEGLDVQVNQLTNLDDTIEGYNTSWIVADVTFTDTSRDGFGAVIPEDCFQLVRKDYEQKFEETIFVTEKGVGLGNFASGDSSEGILQPEYATRWLLYGIDDDWAVFDGAQRRGFVLFNLPEEGHKWNLKSLYFADLNEPVGTESYLSPELIVNQTQLNIVDQGFENQLAALVQQTILKYKSTKGGSGNTGYIQTVGLSSEDGKNNIPMPTIVTSGAEKIKTVKSIEDFIKVMQTVKWLPSKDETWNYRNSPEAVMTQGWGTQWDLAKMAMGLLAKSGATPKQRGIALTETGRQKLFEMSSIEVISKQVLPGIAYTDEKGNEKLFVIPFMKDIQELEGLVYLPSEQDILDFVPKLATVKVSVKIEPGDKSAQSSMGDVADALGGGEGDAKYYDYIELLAKEIPLPDLSLDAIEVGYMEAGMGTGMKYTAAIGTPNGYARSTFAVDSGKDKILGIKIDVELPGNTFSHESSLLEGETLDKLFHTIAINLPDLPEAAAKKLEEATKGEYKAAENPDTLSALKWYSRNILNRFITAQTTFDQELGKDLKLTLGRIDKERCIVLTSCMAVNDDKIRTSMDLLQAVNQPHNGDKNTQAAYNISAGMFVSTLEGKALTGGDKASFIDIWAKAPKDAAMLLIPADVEDPEMGRKISADMEKAGNFPERLINSVADSKKMILAYDKPSDYDGQKRWAWLEIDPVTYETISVFDTGEHASMASYAMAALKDNAGDGGKYIVGGFMGIEVSIWAVATMSLVLDDYDEIIKQAMALAGAIGKHLNDVMKGYDAALDKALSYSPPGNAPININFKLSIADGYEQRIKQNLIGFEQGFNDGMSVYFTLAKRK
ncbi:MAG: hypothetical protein JM58_04385 [Peptococcaceae bacterium BICA1-8]|nr:MAG: hypothetical protein JM58_04385 [Peptococcaceae bacterium BICA1-8]